jgi:nitrite reductase (NO-forming)
LATTVELTLVDTAFEPTELTIPADTDVTINLTNSGVLPHAFEVTDQDIASDEIAGGGTGSVTVNLPAGEYPFICPVPGHADAGMVGILTVQEGGGEGEDATPAEDGAGGQGDGGEAAGATTVNLNMVELSFEPKDFTIPADADVTVNLTNGGALPHAFQLEDGSVESDEIPGGGSGSVTLNLPAGTYPYICPVPGHADGGMVGTITVE